MVIDKGFYVDNFVGTYKIKSDPELNQKIIVSNEYNHPGQGEPPLRKKRIFEYDSKNDEYIYIKLVNVDLNDEKSILNYCNQYGLPYSSQIISDKAQWLGADVASKISDIATMSEPWEYRRNDVMTVEGFSRSVILVRKLLRLRTLLSEKQLDCDQYTELVSILVFFLFFSHKNDFDYSPSEEALPQNRIMRFQYEFQLFLKTANLTKGISESQQVGLFLAIFQALRQENPEKIESKHLLADLNSETVEKIMTIFSFLVYKPWEKHSQYTFTYKSYGEVKFGDSTFVDEDLKNLNQIHELGMDVFRSVINDGIGFVTPELVVENGSLRGDWKLSYQMAGIFMEIFFEETMNFLVRQCDNPTCGHYFSVSRNRPNKKYCCHECGVLMAKRNERKRKKEKALAEKDYTQ